MYAAKQPLQKAQPFSQAIRLPPSSAHCRWPFVMFGIFLVPQAACVAAALLFPEMLQPALSVWLAVEVRAAQEKA